MSELIKEIDEKELEDVVASKRLVLVDFFATWCPPCKMLTPELEKLKQKLGDEIEIVKINTDENEKISRKLRIMSIPSLFIYLDGEMVDETVGYRDVDGLMKLVDRYIETDID